MHIDRTMRVVAFGLACFSAGLFTSEKYYNVAGLWGTRNQLIHVAKEAVIACKENEITAVDAIVSSESGNLPSIADLSDCPKSPVTGRKAPPK